MFTTFTLRTLFTGCSELGVASAPPKREATPTTLAGRAMSWVTCSSLFCRFISLEHPTGTLAAPTASFITPVVVEQVATGPSLTSHALGARFTLVPVTTFTESVGPVSPVSSEPASLELGIGPYRSPPRSALRRCLLKDQLTYRRMCIEYESWKSWQPVRAERAARTWGSGSSDSSDGFLFG